MENVDIYLRDVGIAGTKVEYLPVTELEKQLGSLEVMAEGKVKKMHVANFSDQLKYWKVAGGKVGYLPLKEVEKQLKQLKTTGYEVDIPNFSHQFKGWQAAGGEAHVDPSNALRVVFSDQPTYIAVDFGAGYVSEGEYRAYTMDKICHDIGTWAQRYKDTFAGDFASGLQKKASESDYYIATQYPMIGAEPTQRFWTPATFE